MFRLVDKMLDRITMYRLILYFLFFLIFASFVLMVLELLPFTPFNFVFSFFFISVASFLANKSLAKFFSAPVNPESVSITALILILIITPPKSFFDTGYLLLAAASVIWAMASKFLLVYRKKHIFNPAAFGILLSAVVLEKSASWWVAIPYLSPIIFIGGVLILRKLRMRISMIVSFFIMVFIMILINTPNLNALNIIRDSLLYSPILFFALVMLTEPQTTPPNRVSRIIYGSLVGYLFMSPISLGNIAATPELALVLGNIFSFAVSPKGRLVLSLKEKAKIAAETFEFVFSSNRKINFEPGQYMEWTLPHDADARGIRRFFTIASSPTEEDMLIGVKFNSPGSSFKENLRAMLPGEKIFAHNLSGDFVMPVDTERKLVFMAGGIGITPFRSMIKNLLDKNEKRDIIILYSCKKEEDISYKEMLSAAQSLLSIETKYFLSDKDSIPQYWAGERGYVDEKSIKKHVPDYLERIFYLSGPRKMVLSFEEILLQLNVRQKNIKKDFFSGYV